MQDQIGSRSLFSEFLRKKWVRIVLIIDILALLFLIGFAIYNATRVSTISFNVVPEDSTISVNGNTNYFNGEYRITPGTYEVKISHDGLETKTFTVEVAPQDFVTINTFLTGENDSLEFYSQKKNYGAFLGLQEIASVEKNSTIDNDASAEEFIAKTSRVLSIRDYLPIIYDRYSDGFTNYLRFEIYEDTSSGCEKVLCLKIIDKTGGNEQSAIEYISSLGYNPDDYGLSYELQLSGSVKVRDE